MTTHIGSENKQHDTCTRHGIVSCCARTRPGSVDDDDYLPMVFGLPYDKLSSGSSKKMRMESSKLRYAMINVVEVVTTYDNFDVAHWPLDCNQVCNQ